MAYLVDVHVLDGGCIKEEVVLILAEETDAVLAFADGEARVRAHLSVEDLRQLPRLGHRLMEQHLPVGGPLLVHGGRRARNLCRALLAHLFAALATAEILTAHGVACHSGDTRVPGLLGVRRLARGSCHERIQSK